MTRSILIGADVGDGRHPARNADGGGVNDPSASPLEGLASRLPAICAVFVGLAILVASPHSAMAQGSCTSTPTITDSPPTLTLSGTYTASVKCSGLTQGLKLTLDTDGSIGEENNRIPRSSNVGRGIGLDFALQNNDPTAALDTVIVNRGSIYTASSGIYVKRGHKGILQVDHYGTIDTVYVAIFLEAQGQGSIKLTTGAESVIKTTEHTSSANGTISVSISQDRSGNIEIIHKGKIDSKKSAGIFARHHGSGKTSITTEEGSSIVTERSGAGGYSGINVSARGTGKSGITVTHNGEINSKAEGIYAAVRNLDGGAAATATGSVTVTTGKKSKIVADRHGMYIVHEGTGESAITITHKGNMDVKNSGGMFIYNRGSGKTSITTEEGSSIVSGSATPGNAGIDVSARATGKSDVTVTHDGEMNAKAEGIYASVRELNEGAAATATGSVTITTGKKSKIAAGRSGMYTLHHGVGAITITHNGMIDAQIDGIYAEITNSSSTNKIVIDTAAGSEVTAKQHGIHVKHNGGGDQAGQGTFALALRGMVMGESVETKESGSTDYAGVHIETGSKGGTIVIGDRAHVSSLSKTKTKTASENKIAIQVKANVGPVTIVLEEDDAGVVGHVEGQILNPTGSGTRSALTFKTRSASGTDTELTAGDATKGIVYRRGETTGVYDKVIKAQLKTITGKEGYWFEDDTTMDLRLYSNRSRLYEVLPSVLLGLVELTPYSTRMAVPRQTTGETVMLESSRGERVAVPRPRMDIWVRMAVRDGERMAKTATTAQDFRGQSLAWDVKQTDLEAGRDVATDASLMMGVSAHYRQGKATVRRGGTVEATGAGMGLSLTWTGDNGLYVDGQLAYTRFFDVTMVSSTSSVGTITSTGGGNGLAVGVEVGQPMSLGDMTVTPRGGLSWSSVDLDAFDEPATIDGASRIAPSKEQSVQGRVGVLAELGPAGANSRLYASLDLEHEFSPELAVMAGDARLTAKGKPTWVRVGVGGSMSLGGSDTMMLAGDAFYATAGSDNTDFGGGVALTFRF